MTAQLDGSAGSDGAETVSFGQALAMAQDDAMTEDPTITLLGQDIRAGFPFGATKGLVDRHGENRVINTPISEAATMGCGIGAAMAGVRTVVEVDFAGFALLALDQLVNNAAKLRYMSGDQVSVPLVVRIGQGPLGSFAAQHSQSQHAYLSGIPGLMTLAPATPQAAYDVMRWALGQDHPVVVLEDMRLYRRSGEVRRREVHSRPSATAYLDGSDLTILTYGFGVHICLEAADILSSRGIQATVVGLDALSPLDIDAIRNSVRSTGRGLVVSDDPLLYGVAATLCWVANVEAHDALHAPVVALGGLDTPTPYAPDLEKLVYPDATSVVAAAERLLAWGA